MTLVLKFLAVKSHALSPRVIQLLKAFVEGLEEGLQSTAYKVGNAMVQHPAFDAKWVESPLIRALICSIARQAQIPGLKVEELTNGGVELCITEQGVDYRFRVKRARLDAFGRWDVRVSTDSLLASPNVLQPTLFDGDFEPLRMERWVMAYLLDPGTRTFAEISVARIVGFLTSSPPYRLALADVVHIPLAAPLPPSFDPDEDDLAFPDEEEDGNEAAE